MAVKSKSVSGTDRVYAIALIHLILCITIIAALTPGDEALSLGGVLIAPALQWWNAAFNAFSIVAIILAAVGILYFIEWHLDLYLAVLAISLVIDLVWFAVFLVYGASCTSGESTMSCSFHAGAVIIVIVAIVLFKVFAVWSVLKAKRAVRIKYNEELLPYLRASATRNWGEGGAAMLKDGAEAMDGGQALDSNGKVFFSGVSGTANAGAAAAGLNSLGAKGEALSFAGKPDGSMWVSRADAGGAATGGYGALGATTVPAGSASCYGVGSATGLPLSSSAGAARATSMGAAGLVGAPVPLSSSMGAPVLAPRAAISSSIAPISGSTVATTQVATAPGTPQGSLLAVPSTAVARMQAPVPAASPPGALDAGQCGFTFPPTPGAMAAPPTTGFQSVASVAGTPIAMGGSPTAAAAGASMLFDQIDVDGDGTITREEFERFQAASASSMTLPAAGSPAPA